MSNPFGSDFEEDPVFSGNNATTQQAQAGTGAQTAAALQHDKKTLHPITVFFTLFFKAIAICSYILLNMILDNFIITFIIIIFALAFDFWTVKNVSGRLLVGLRWWNHIGHDGKGTWVFEASTTKAVHPFDSMVFWGSLCLTPIAWIVFGLILSGFEVKWLLVVAIAVVLSTANFVAYWRCHRKGASTQTYLTNQVAQRAITQTLEAQQV